MTKRSLSKEELKKLAEALKIAKDAEENASQMSQLATKIADRYQKHLDRSVESTRTQ